MKKTLTLLVASTALTATIGVPAWSAMQTPSDDLQPVAALFEDVSQAMPLILASDDDDEDRWRVGSRRTHDDDDDDEDDCDDDDDDDDDYGDGDDEDDCRDGTSNPAPAGTVAPPQNGLFGGGTPPRVQVN